MCHCSLPHLIIPCNRDITSLIVNHAIFGGDSAYVICQNQYSTSPPDAKTKYVCRLLPPCAFHFSLAILPMLQQSKLHKRNSSYPLSDTSRTRSTLREARALSLLTLSHLNLVCLPLQILLVPALHPIHLWSPALRRAGKNLALAISSAVWDANRVCSIGLRLGIGVVCRSGVERDSGFCG
jgi:hypothetical protein